jgi:hypothetical protein
MLSPFINETYLDFSIPANRKSMMDAIGLVEGTFGRHYPLNVGGKEIYTDREIASLNPSDPSQVVGFV